jgi:hypothetical protein
MIELAIIVSETIASQIVAREAFAPETSCRRESRKNDNNGIDHSFGLT